MGILDKIRNRGVAGTRVFVLGLDGTPYGLIQDLFSRGILNNLSEIAGKGNCLRMSTTVPDVSSVAWTTFMTGVNPGRHGIFGFMDMKPGTYSTHFPNSTHVRSPCLWHLIGREGKRSVIVNMPSTYPAQELKGTLIAGFVAIDLQRATYPKSLVPWLEKIDYMLDVDASKAQTDQEAFFTDLHTSLELREKTIRKLMKEEDWDLFAAIVTGTDRLHHFFWDAYENEDSPFHSSFLDYYRAIDDMAGRLYDDLNGKATFFALSDHGFGPLRRDLYVNRWLEEHGYLCFSGESRESIADADPARTRAFCLDPGRIYINLKRRFPGGSVAPGKAYESLVEELAQALSTLTFSSDSSASETVIRQVFRKEELYQGPFLTSAPDLVLLAQPGTNLKGAPGRAHIFDTQGPFTGMHTQDDAFFMCDHPVSGIEDINILDASKTILTSLESSGADLVEGRPLLSSEG